MYELPAGTVTFLFTDIQGSTRLWEQAPDKMEAALERHDELMQQAISKNSGYTFKTVGDAFCAAFHTAPEGLQAAIDAQMAILNEEWHLPRPIRVRMGIHTGEAAMRGDDYFGRTLNRVARLQGTSHGGQVVISLVTAELVRDVLPDGCHLKDLGEVRLRDLTRSETVFQVIHRDLPAKFPPLKSIDTLPNNLPIQPTPLIGREKELVLTEKMIIEKEARLLSLIGPGGMGKSRMALQIAADLIEKFKDGVYLVELESITEPDLIIPAISDVLGVKESGNIPMQVLVKQFLKNKNMLLILDNFEQVMGGRSTVIDLMTICPKVVFIITSREALHIRGEQEYKVPALTLPWEKSTEQSIKRSNLTPESLSQYESVRLFIERAISVKQDFEITSENAPAVAEICVRLDGLPLAIELAAARIKLFHPDVILKRLETALKFLKDGALDLPERQKTLRAAIGWSYDLLSNKEKRLFRYLSVFDGSFSIEIAEAIVIGINQKEEDVLEGISQLLDKNLLTHDRSNKDESRFRLLTTIREFGLEKLNQEDEFKKVHHVYAEHYITLTNSLGTELLLTGEKYLLVRFGSEYENIRGLLNYFGTQNNLNKLRSLSGESWPYYLYRGMFSEGLSWLRKSLGIDEIEPGAAKQYADTDQDTIESVAKVFFGIGSIALRQDDYSKAKISLEEALLLSETINLKIKIHLINIELGWIEYYLRNMERAKYYFNKAMPDREVDRKTTILCSLCRLGLGTVNWAAGNLVEAESLLLKSNTTFSSLKTSRWEAMSSENLGLLYIRKEDKIKGEFLLLKAARILSIMDDKAGLLFVYNNLGWLYGLKADNKKSAQYYKKLIKLSIQIGNTKMESIALSGFAEAKITSDQAGLAIRYANRAVRIAKQCGDGQALGTAYLALGESLAELRKMSDAKITLQKCVPLLKESNAMEELERAEKKLFLLEKKV
jgi:predicted ATPase/class 3 adenylate cyclase